MLGVCYYPEHWPRDLWTDDAARMFAMGIRYVRIGEFAWSRLEPRPGELHLDWLREALDVLGAAGLKVVLGTPTATPPKWLIDQHPDILPVDEKGATRGFGSRRHTSFSAPVWLEQSRRIVEILAREFGTHPAIAGWQTDNEYGCHNTVLSYGPHDLAAFQLWLERHYGSIDALNRAWGNVFWSMELNAFSEVTLPAGAVTETNPAARLDFWRFSSDQVAAYDLMQIEIIRAYAPGRFITHNFMGFFHEFDHFKLGENLDFASWDSYPLGFVERFPFSEAERLRWAETSHPDVAPFHHDLYRGVGRGRFWVMEQQPGPVNWAPWNPIPRPGQIRLFTFEALAHGAEVVSYFRWRQAPFAQEQMHAGLNLPDNSGLSPGGHEATQAGAELARLGPLPASKQADVALVFDYASSWMTRIQPQGQDFNYSELTFRWYEAARRMGLDLDIVPPGASLAGYKLVLVPSLLHVSDAAAAAFAAAEGEVLWGPRSGSKTQDFSIAAHLPPGPLTALVPARVIEVASLRPGLGVAVRGEVNGAVERWREHVIAAAPATIRARFADGQAALVSQGAQHYLAGWPDEALLTSLMADMAAKAGLTTMNLPDHIRIRYRGAWGFAFNYGTQDFTLPVLESQILLGSRSLPPSGVTIWRRSP